MKVTIYCSFDFSTFPFDSNTCNFTFGLNFWSENFMTMTPTTISYKNELTKAGQKPIKGVKNYQAQDNDCLVFN